MKRCPLRAFTVMLIFTVFMQVISIPLQTVNATAAKTKQKLVQLDKNWNAIGQYSEGLCPVQDKTSGMWGYVDKTGKYIIKPEYYEAMPFSEGLAAVKNSSGFFNFVNKTGKIVVAGKFTNVLPRFSGDYAGYKNGYAVVSFHVDNVNRRSNYTLIDKKGSIVKELDDNTAYVIDMGRFENKGSIVTNRDNTGAIYDIKYNKVAEFEGEPSDRISFNHSSKYLILDDRNYENEGKGFIIGAANGSEVFTQSQIQGIDNSNSYKIGVTDDYVIISRNINGINTSAVFDFKGKTIIDYKYKEIMPISKDMFLVKNNAGTFVIIDTKQKEVLPFSLGLNVLCRADQLEMVYEQAMKSGAYHFVIKDKQGKEKAKYFDIKTKKINDYSMMKVNGWSVNAYEFRHNTEAGLIHISELQYSATVYNSSLQQIGYIERYFTWGDFGKLISNKEPFLAAGVIPVLRKDGMGYTFAVIQKQ